ncbi:hypothetical protein D6C76_01819 [Aureobasidium pullulans]|nr:hypothetical protein D6C76_01819 [Aureobasidium pullulans]
MAQIDTSMAFNIAGVAYDHGIDTTDIAANSILRYDKHITRTRKQRQKKAASNRTGSGRAKGKERAVEDSEEEDDEGRGITEDDWDSAPSLVPSTQEKEISDEEGVMLDPEEHNLCLWVGMMPSDASSYRSKSAPAGKTIYKGLNKSILNTPASRLTVLDTDQRALRVFVMIKGSDNATAPLAVSIAPDNNSGLCRLKSCHKEDVFFFQEYRDDNEGNRNNRRMSWAMLYRNRVRVITGQPTVTAAAVSRTFADNDEQINTHPAINLGQKLHLLGAAYRQGKGLWAIDAMRELLKKADAGDLGHRPAQAATLNLERILDISQECYYDQVREAMNELCKLWPELGAEHLTTDEMMQMAGGLRVGQVVLEFRLLRPFVIEWNRQWSGRFWTGEELGQLAVDSRNFVQKLMGDGNPPTTVSGLGAPTIPLYRHARDALREVAAHAGRRHQALLDAAGTASTKVNSLGQIYEDFKNANDTDSAKLMAQQALQYSLTEMGQITKATTGPVDELADIFDKVILDVEIHYGMEE